MGRSTTPIALLFGGALVAAAVAVSPQLKRTSDTGDSAHQLSLSPVPVSSSAGSIDAETFRRIAAAQMLTVVNIRSESRRQTRVPGERFGGDDPLGRFFGRPDMGALPREEFSQGVGSGFVIDKAGLILTNSHVVEGTARIEVGLFAGVPGNEDDRTFHARVIGRDPLTDSALIRLVEKPAFDLAVATFGDSDQMSAGDWVMAIGNPFNLSHTVTVGVISAKERPFQPLEGRVQEMLQTDAAINPGNSGGPLLNLRGEVIGINTAILSSSPVAGNVGIGFAVPINVVRSLLPQLNEGKVTRGRIGVQVTNVPREGARALGLDAPRGALVAAVEPGSPAARADVKPGDVILEFQGKPLKGSSELTREVVTAKPGSAATMTVLRDGKPRKLTVTVEALDVTAGEESAGAADEGLEGFGLSLAPLTPEMARQLQVPPGEGAAVVTAVTPRGGAAQGGIQPGDVIVEVNRRRVTRLEDVLSELRTVPSGETAFLLVARSGRHIFIPITKPKES